MRIACLLLASALFFPAAAGAAGWPVSGTYEDTGEKPQSKLWYNDGRWHAILKKQGHGLHFYEFDSGAWIESTFPAATLGSGGQADVKWNGEELFVLAYSATPKLFKYTYEKPTRIFHLVPGFPVALPIADGSETMVLDQDSTGRLWATYEAGSGAVYVCWSTSADHREWFLPGMIVRSGVDEDDISTLVAFDRKIGVFWSDQSRWQFGFRIHQDGDAPETWQSTQVVASGDGIADDHINMKADGAGNLYAVTKDIENTMRLHYRNVATGKWTTKTGVISGTGTRGIVLLSDQDRAIYVPYTTWSSSNNDIKLRRASYGTMSFSTWQSPVVSGTTFNNATGTKQVLPSGCFMVMAEGGGRTYWNGWGELPPDGPPPPPPPAAVRLEVLATAGPASTAASLALDLPLDEGAGTTATDRTAAHHTAQLLSPAGKTPPAWIAGHQGAALAFDGTTWAEIPSADGLRIAASLTVEAWVRWDGSSSIGTVLSKGRSGSRNYQIVVRGDGLVEYRWETTNGYARSLAGTRAVSAGRWHHIACVRDVGAGTTSIYLDGRLDATKSETGTPRASDDPLVLGMRMTTTSTADWLRGAVDGVRVWHGVAYARDFDPEIPPPTGPQYTTTTQVQIAWESPDPMQPLTYRLYRSVNGAARARLAADLAATAFLDSNLLSGTLCYQVSAIDSAGREGRLSAPTCTSWATTGPPLPDLMHPSIQGVASPVVLRATPNPFNPRTRIDLALPAAGPVRLAVYDVAGRCVAILHEGPLAAGEHRFDWNAAAGGARLASGVYFARLETPGERRTQKLLLVQ